MLKKENKKEKAKKLLLSEQRKTAINIVGVFQKFFRRRKFKKKIMLVLEIKRCQTEIEKEEQNLRIITKRINLLNDLIIGVKELENVYFAR